MKEIQLEPNDLHTIVATNLLHSNYIPIQSPILQIPDLHRNDIESIVEQIGEKNENGGGTLDQQFDHGFIRGNYTVSFSS